MWSSCLTLSQMTALGLDGFAIDVIEAEPAVRTFLCQTAAFHQNVSMSERLDPLMERL